MSKITLDLDDLLASGKIDQAEVDRLKALALPSKRLSILANILCIFGAIALAVGVLALIPNATTGLFLALVALAIATFIRLTAYEEWRILCDGMAIAGIGGICGWLGLEFGENLGGAIVNTIIFLIITAGALAYKNAFIAAFSPLALGSIIGSGTAYWHASYGIFVREALISIILFSAVALALYYVTKRVLTGRLSSWKMVGLIPARVSLFMVNFGFWVGSLWGDWPGEHFTDIALLRDDTASNGPTLAQWRENAFFIPDWVFSLGWAAFLVICILWGLRNYNRFVTNTSIVFLAIHFYTQLFEYFGAEPGTLVFGGIIMLGLAIWLFRFDRKTFADAA